MTTLVYSKTEHALFADSRCTDNRGYVMDDDAEKIVVYPNGDVLVLAGDVIACEIVEDNWPNIQAACEELAGGHNGCQGFLYEVESDTVSSLCVAPDDMGNVSATCWRINHDYAFGSGSDFAIAALDFGMGPAQAIEYASTRDTGTNNRVKTIDLVKHRETYDDEAD